MADKLDQSDIDAMLNEARQTFAAESAAEIQPPAEEKAAAEHEQSKGPVVEKVEFASFQPHTLVPAEQKKELGFFNHIPLIISGELGQAHLTVRELLKLEEGSIVKLDKLAGESATILVNGQFLGSAEIVVINERFGLRVTTIGSPDQNEEKHDERNEPESQEVLPEEQELSDE